VISHRYEPSPDTRGHGAHPACLTGPGGNHGAAIRICSDKTELRSASAPAQSAGNRLIGNHLSSHYGIIAQGLRRPGDVALVPHDNDFENNDVSGSKDRCADQFNPSWSGAAVRSNKWNNNNCRGTQSWNTAPTYFEGYSSP
jgi:hypothetical protein